MNIGRYQQKKLWAKYDTLWTTVELTLNSSHV